MKTVRLIINGRVHGVFFRASAKDIADELGVKGWVRNLPDRNVEIAATAGEETLELFIKWCKQGPPRAIVNNVIIEEVILEEFIGFRIIR
jgi:acylphosphatase